MSALRRCLALVLDVSVEDLPEPDGDDIVFWRQWLAQRNLGLVHRGGLRADVVSDGVIAPGDSIRAC